MTGAPGRRVIVLLFAVTACSLGPSGPDLDPGDADLTVLFVGNSLTAAHDLPGMVAAVAEARGEAWLTLARTSPNASLEDHWNAGGPDAVRSASADFVVLQQGPSSLPANAEHLSHWAGRFDGPIREAGGRPVLFMVWPARDRWHALDDVRGSYAAAAESVDGVLAPAGSVWGRLIEGNPSFPLTASDGFHPSRLGSYAAALTIYGALAGSGPSDLPCPALAGTEEQREEVCRAVRPGGLAR